MWKTFAYKCAPKITILLIVVTLVTALFEHPVACPAEFFWIDIGITTICGIIWVWVCFREKRFFLP